MPLIEPPGGSSPYPTGQAGPYKSLRMVPTMVVHSRANQEFTVQGMGHLLKLIISIALENLLYIAFVLYKMTHLSGYQILLCIIHKNR